MPTSPHAYLLLCLLTILYPCYEDLYVLFSQFILSHLPSLFSFFHSHWALILTVPADLESSPLFPFCSSLKHTLNIQQQYSSG